ncbi:MAG: hypothetical protein OXI20_10370 [Rhodospirillales bacterium]|nr:hypothetical protein [Rhodospirillales bacterium]
MRKRATGRSPDWPKINAVVLAADTDAAILDALAHSAWAEARRDGDPDVPALSELAAWLVDDDALTAPVLQHAHDRLAEVVGAGAEWVAVNSVRLAIGGRIEQHYGPPDPGSLQLVAISADRTISVIAEVHRAWAAFEADVRPRHPLLPLVAGWQARPHEVKSAKLTRRASLPRLHRASAGEAAFLPGFESFQAPAQRRVLDPVPGVLPGFEPFLAGGVPSWLLALFDSTGEVSMHPGRGAPWALRLFVYACLHVRTEDRDGRSVILPWTLAYVERMLWPNGWNRANRRRDWRQFRTVMKRLGALRPSVVGPDGLEYLVEIVSVPVVPREWSPTAKMPVRVAIPASAAAGARVADWPLLVQHGAESAPLFRAHLAAVAILDYAARRGHGITQTIEAVVTREDGRPVRGKGGRLVRDRGREIPNPAARFVGRLTDDDLRRAVGLVEHRENRKRARVAFERLHADGVIELRRERDGTVRIFAPSGRSQPVTRGSSQPVTRGVVNR